MNTTDVVATRLTKEDLDLLDQVRGDLSRAAALRLAVWEYWKLASITSDELLEVA